MAEQGDNNGAGGRWQGREIITEPGEDGRAGERRAEGRWQSRGTQSRGAMAEQGNAEQRDDGRAGEHRAEGR